jgi:H+/Cl- antiporter ClcA
MRMCNFECVRLCLRGCVCVCVCGLVGAFAASGVQAAASVRASGSESLESEESKLLYFLPLAYLLAFFLLCAYREKRKTARHSFVPRVTGAHTMYTLHFPDVHRMSVRGGTAWGG